MCYHIFLSMDAPQELRYNDISEDMTKLCIGQGILAVLPGNTVTTNEKKKKKQEEVETSIIFASVSLLLRRNLTLLKSGPSPV